jgi:hypothetical protein
MKVKGSGLSAGLLSRSSWRCIHLIRTVSSEDIERLVQRGLDVVAVEVSESYDNAILIRQIAEAFGFPDGYGENWNAVNDFLSDMSWRPPRTGVVLVARCEGERLSERFELIGELIRSWLYAAEHWSRKQVAWHLVLCERAP